MYDEYSVNMSMYIRLNFFSDELIITYAFLMISTFFYRLFALDNEGMYMGLNRFISASDVTSSGLCSVCVTYLRG